MKRPVFSQVVAFLVLTAGGAHADNAMPVRDASRQSLDDAWWTGPILAASASTLQKGHFLIEPYVFDVITSHRYDDSGNRQGTARVDGFGSLTYILYGVTDDLTAGVIPTFGFNDVSEGRDSSGIRVGDLTAQAQYRLTRFREGGWLPTTSLVLQQSLPTGKHDQLGSRPNDGIGSGAHSTTLAVYSQHYFWMPNGRILRTRFNVSRTFSDEASVRDVSVYGTGEGFRGHAQPGESSLVNLSGEYSLTRNWVLALDLYYQRDANTRVRGHVTELISGQPQQVEVHANSGSSWRFGLAPAIEYNWTGNVGVIVGARWVADGRNVGATFTPVAAINLVY
jgi:hypothetical protein